MANCFLEKSVDNPETLATATTANANIHKNFSLKHEALHQLKKQNKNDIQIFIVFIPLQCFYISFNKNSITVDLTLTAVTSAKATHAS